MFRIKICGVRLKNDVQAVERSGADAIGLNFFPQSVRYVDPVDETTKSLSDLAAELGLTRIGVFVNESVDSILRTVSLVGLDAVQLHGDEPAETALCLLAKKIRVIRAIKLPREPFEPSRVDQILEQWRGCDLLLDADAGTRHGGGGKALHWPSVRAWALRSPGHSWTLAGGLTPENIAEAILASGATSIDTASGVECPKGVKSADRIATFAAQAQAAWNAWEPQ